MFLTDKGTQRRYILFRNLLEIQSLISNADIVFQPSSSGRSAELLGTNIPQFTVFSTSKDHGFSLKSLSIPEDVDSSIDSNFQLVLKKMNKKDSTTKLKVIIVCHS